MAAAGTVLTMLMVMLMVLMIMVLQVQFHHGRSWSCGHGDAHGLRGHGHDDGAHAHVAPLPLHDVPRQELSSPDYPVPSITLRICSPDNFAQSVVIMAAFDSIPEFY